MSHRVALPKELLEADPNTLEATGSVLKNALGERPSDFKALKKRCVSPGVHELYVIAQRRGLRDI